MPPKKIGILNGVEIQISSKKWKNTFFKSHTIAAKKTFDNFENGVENAQALNYKDLQQFIDENKEKFMKANGRYQINIISANGWRGGKRFDGFNANWYDPAVYYNDGADNIDVVYGIQILDFNPE